MKTRLLWFGGVIALLLLSTCTPQQAVPTSKIMPTKAPTSTPAPTSTITPIPPTATRTAKPPTATPIPQRLFLRRRCGRDYVVRAGQPVQIFYGVWGVRDKELADQWATALSVDLTIGAEEVAGQLQPPVQEPLPYNCRPSRFEETHWLYYAVTIPGFSRGQHKVTVSFASLRPLPDGFGLTYGPGEFQEHTFFVTAE